MTEFARFAAADACPAEFAVKAMGRVVAGAFLSSFVGPGLVAIGAAIAGRDAALLHQYACFYFSCSVLCLVYIGCAACLRLPPHQAGVAEVSNSSRKEILQRKGVQVAFSCSFGAQWYMVLIMSATPVAMNRYLHLAGATWEVSTVISLHMLGMFATGFFSGQFHARVGTISMMATGWVVSAIGITFAFLIHGLSTRYTVTLTFFYLALLALGMGWHFAFIGASKLLLENHSKAEQALVQGGNEQLRFIANSAAILLAGSLEWPVVTYLAAPVLVLMVAFAGCRLSCSQRH
jgi:hypothetical protein